MKKIQVHKTLSYTSSISIKADGNTIWDNITNVQIEQFSDPIIFKILGIPKPLKAEIITREMGGKRIAYFDSGKRFLQEITTWSPNTKYSFDFNPEKGFIVGHVFDIADGVFRILSGNYVLSKTGESITLELTTSYSLDRRIYFLLNTPVLIILKIFQRYLLTSIKENCE
ncbi:hypothetical protein [Aureibacter tunicatorum]|uniref:Uncharacterized protein n=1 Tax=Aureibacter tunicatorum TaxID=866807 RepID=A0AAE4BUQ1_9BACT|nr:hypothetical protein [Aureibacter tunicatorum]MDR6241003.1 hypothetical protein [Aureibacter tunicatorum]BDD03781.1 hypothetical protein AUTU_12640 [Aureibacter tunicatorum]